MVCKRGCDALGSLLCKSRSLDEIQEILDLLVTDDRRLDYAHKRRSTKVSKLPPITLLVKYASKISDLDDCQREDRFTRLLDDLQRRGADINPPKDKYKLTPIEVALNETDSWRWKLYSVLVSRGADVNADLDSRGTPLTIAAKKLQVDIVEDLL